MSLQKNKNITTDGLYYSDSEIECYNGNGYLSVVHCATGQTKIIKYNGYFINRVSSYILFTPKEKGFVLLAFNIFTDEIKQITNCDTRWCTVKDDRYIYYTKGNTNYLYEYDVILESEKCLLEHSCNYIVNIGPTLYFSDWSNKQYLCSLDIVTLEYKCNLEFDVAWLNVIDTKNLIFRCWHNRKTYRYDLSTGQVFLINTDSANYCCYNNGFLYYDNVKYGGLFQQSIYNRNIKRRLCNNKSRRIAIVDNNTICFQCNKQICFLKIDYIFH